MREVIVAVLWAAILVVMFTKNERPEEQPCDAPQLLSVMPHHSTRVYATYSCADGTSRRYSVHATDVVRCGTISISVNDYLTGKQPYGKCDK